MTRVGSDPPDSQTSALAVWSALTAVYLIWGSTYLAIRFTVETVPPFLSAAARFVTSGAFLYLWRRCAGDSPPDIAEWRSAAIIGGLLLLGGNGGVVWAAQFIPSSLAALLVATVPLWMIVIDALRPGGGWPDWSSILGIALGFCGAALLIGWNANAADSAYLHGALAVVAASFLWALGSIYAKTARLPRSPLMVTGMEMLVGGTAQIIPAWTSGEFAVFTLDSVSWRSALSWIYLTVVGPIAFAAYAWLLRNAPIPLVATYSYVNPVVAICLGYFLGRELISPRILIAAALVVGSVALVNRAR